MEKGKVSKVATTFTVDKAAQLPYGTVEAIIATEGLDRHNEHMSVKGIETPRSNYKAYYNHAYDGNNLPVGIIEQLRKTKGQLIGRIKLAVAEYPFAEQLYKLIQGGYVDSMSIGFIPKEWDESTLTWVKSEFVEASFVAEPANVEALIAAKGLSKDEAKEMHKLFEMEKDFADQVTDHVKRITAELNDLPIDDVKAVLSNVKSSIGAVEALLSDTPATTAKDEKKHLIKVRLAAKDVAKQGDALNRVLKVKLSKSIKE